MHIKNVGMSEQISQNIYSIKKPNSAKLGITISEEVTCLTAGQKFRFAQVVHS